MIRSLNLDGMFLPVKAPEIEFEIKKFSGGETHVRLNNNIDYSSITTVWLTCRANGAEDITEALLVNNALKEAGVRMVKLVIPYLPYARQDRVCHKGDAFSLKVFADIINTAEFEEVICMDPHSDVAEGLINNLCHIGTGPSITSTLSEIDEIIKGPVMLISPDEGAKLKVRDISERLRRPYEDLIVCEKKRDPATGALSGFKVLSDDLKGRNCLIIDDICDGGGTFLGLYDELKRKNAGDIYLYVTHGIFSKGLACLTGKFKKIFTTNSIKEIANHNVKQFKIEI